MTNTEIVISNNGIRPIGDVSEEAQGKARAYIQSGYIKRELVSEFSNEVKIIKLNKKMTNRKFTSVTNFKEMLEDRVDRIRSPQRINLINQHVEDMEYVKAIREIFK